MRSRGPFLAGVGSVFLALPIFGWLVMKLFDVILNRAVRTIAQ